MRNKFIWTIISVLLIFVVSLYVALPDQVPVKFSWRGFEIDQIVYKKQIGPKFELQLGLDLIGGSHLVFVADTSKLPEDKKERALQSLKDVIERRVNLFGVSEPNIQESRDGNNFKIIVELPGIKDTKEAVDLVGQTAQLQFNEVIDEEEKQTLKPVGLTGADLKDADVGFDQLFGKPVVNLTFNEEGASKFESLTEKNVGRPVPITLDNQLVSAPVVREKITGGTAQISGEFSLDEAKRLAIQLNAGSLPVPVSLVEQRSVGATLGQESIDKSIKAGLVGIGIVFIFMIIMYGKLGLIANIGLVFFAILTLAVYKLVPVVLTLPGIAGFLLSVGMAVDANILIFERFKEEKKIKGNVQDALESSFGRAWDSIRDANIATLIAAFILANPLDWQFLHTSGPVRGFAITLALGIGISLFTGIYVSRNLLRIFIRK